MRYSAVLPSSVDEEAVGHLLRRDRQEDLTFGLYYPSQGKERRTGIVRELVLPREGDRNVHRNVSFNAQYVERALAAALEAGAGLVLMHSHVGPGWQDLSPDDYVAESTLAARASGATGLPLLGLTLGTDGAWSARFWYRTGPRVYQPAWCESVRVVGAQLRVTYDERQLPPPTTNARLQRTTAAWGEKVQADVARLRVGIIGAGNVGSVVGVAIAKMGIQAPVVLDFDVLKVHNLDRQLGAELKDVGLAKVDVLAREMTRNATARGFDVTALDWSVTEREGYLAALDCDILFSCVDRPWPRSVLNFIAYAHAIPVIDGGVLVTAGPKGLKRADWRAHTVGIDHQCLECLGQYNPADVATDRDGFFDDPTYIQGLPADHPVRRSENVFCFGLAAGAMEVNQFVSVTAVPSGLAAPGAQMYHLIPGSIDRDVRSCAAHCPFPGLVGLGDHAGGAGTGRHAAAEQARAARAEQQPGAEVIAWVSEGSHVDH